MDFDSIDWEAETIRVTRAFGVVGECAFIEESDNKGRRLKRPMNLFATIRSRVLNKAKRYWEQAPFRVLTEDGLYLTVSYLVRPNTFRQEFALSDSEIVYNRVGNTVLRVERHGPTLCTLPYANIYAHQMAKGLYHLDLLTPEVEAALGVSISAHEKMEWTLEYERRFG